MGYLQEGEVQRHEVRRMIPLGSIRAHYFANIHLGGLGYAGVGRQEVVRRERRGQSEGLASNCLQGMKGATSISELTARQPLPSAHWSMVEDTDFLIAFIGLSSPVREVF